MEHVGYGFCRAAGAEYIGMAYPVGHFMADHKVRQADFKADHIGVVAGKFLVGAYLDAVYSPNGAGGFIQVAEKRQDAFLVGDGDVDAFQVGMLREQLRKIGDLLQREQLITGVWDIFTGEFFRKIAFRKRMGQGPADERVEVCDGYCVMRWTYMLEIAGLFSPTNIGIFTLSK